MGSLFRNTSLTWMTLEKTMSRKIRAQFNELFQKTNAADSYRLLAELAIEVGYFVPACGIFFKKMGDAVSYIKTKNRR